jgi:hypothetical protein
LPTLKAFIVLPLTLLSAGCAQAPASEPSARALAPWLQAKIAQFESGAPASPPRAILQAVDQGRTVYYVTPTCCDIPSELYDEGGSLLCFPDGGFAGGDGRCPTFRLPGNAATVWRDQRAAPVRGPAAPASR